MSQACMGAMVQYCGHDGCFVADIFLVEGANVVVANGPVTPENLRRPAAKFEPTHHLRDYPRAGCWKPHKGFYVVPEDQVVDLREPKEDKKS